MSDGQSSENSGMEMVIELPPPLLKFLSMLGDDQKRLLKDKAFSDPNQLRKFIATTLMERIVQAVEMLGTSMTDVHQIGLANMEQLQRQRRWVAKHLRKLGAEVSDGDMSQLVGKNELVAVSNSLYALGSYLESKYPGDAQLSELFNRSVGAVNALYVALMGNQEYEDDEEDDEEDEGEKEISDGPEGDGEGDVEPTDDQPGEGGPS